MGMLFDHGCDSFTVTFVISATAKFVNFGNSIHTIIWFSQCISLFHFAMLEEYYVGGMILGYGNPITDLSIAVYILYISLGIWGNGFMKTIIFEKGWLFMSCPNLSALDVWFYVSGFFMGGNALLCVYKIFKNERYEGKGKDAKWYIVLYQVLAYLFMVLGVVSLAYVGENPLMEQTEEKGQWPVFWVILLQGMMQMHMSIHIMLFEATGMSYNPMDNRLYVFVMMVIGLIWTLQKQLNIKVCVILLTIITICCSLYYIMKLMYELSKVLKIQCFKVKQKNEESLLTTKKN
jgi:hypothetical protein